MLKKTLSLILWLIISVLVLFICYIIGILQNWSLTTIIFSWISVILIALCLKWIVDYICLFISGEKYHFFSKKYRWGERKSAIYTYHRNCLNILKKKKQRKMPWFILTGHTEHNNSLLKGLQLPLFHSKGKDNFSQPIRSLRWWFFHNMSVVEVSSRIYNVPGLFNIIIKLLTLRFCIKKKPSGLIIVFPVDKLLNDEYADVQVLAQKYRSFTEQLSSKMHYNIPVYLIISNCDSMDGFSILVDQLLQKGEYSILRYFLPSHSPLEEDINKNTFVILSALKRRITSSICYALDGSLAEKEKLALLQLPERIMDMQKSLNTFLSNFCIPNAYFATTKFSGIWLTESMLSVHRKSGSFPDVLISEILPQIHKSNYFTDRTERKGIILKPCIALTILCYLGYSAYHTSQLIPASFVAAPELLTQELLQNEQHHQLPWIYIPFSPILKERALQISEKILKDNNIKIRPEYDIIYKYKENYMSATQQDKRDMILSLAATLVTWEKMRNHEQLINLCHDRPKIPEELKFAVIEGKHSLFTALAVERAVMEQVDGGKKIEKFRTLLTELINSDPTYAWLVSPHESIQNIELSDFFVDADHSVVLPGIWTLKGQKLLHRWYAQINEAYKGNEVPEGLSSFIQHLDEGRQDNFRKFILAANKWNKYSRFELMTSIQLTDIIHNRSSVRFFFQFIDKELQAIPTISAQNWLTHFRLFYHMYSLVHENDLMRYIKQSDLMVRMRLSYMSQKNRFPDMSERLSAWMEFHDAINFVANEEMNTISSVRMVKGALLADKNLQTSNKLVQLFDKFENMKSIFIGNKNDSVMDAVLSIYEQHAYQLLNNASVQASCWIDEQWKNTVLQPLNASPGNVSHAEMQKSTYLHIIDFLNGPAKGFMVMDPEGVRLLSYKGHTISFVPDFIHFINEVVTPDDLLDVPLQQRTHDKDELADIQGQLAILNEKKQQLESQPYKVTVNTAPATISDGSRIKPTGTYLELDCDTGNSVIRSMNFADSAVFTWYPGKCHNVNINIDFPTFSVKYTFIGDSAWTDFINKFSDGEVELLKEDFPPETKTLLELMHINSILVRYKISDPTAINKAYMDWEHLKQQIEEQVRLQNDLNNKLFTNEKEDQSGWLSRLPNNITTCPILQE